jgi:hypothetical protein
MSSFTYGDNWEKKKRFCKCLYNRCTQNPIHSGNIAIHHLKYKRSIPRRILGIFLLHNPFKASVSGLEIPGWDIVPVCSECHENAYGRSLSSRSVHCKGKWIQKGGLENRNTFITAWKLRIMFVFWAMIFNFFKLVCLGLVK